LLISWLVCTSAEAGGAMSYGGVDWLGEILSEPLVRYPVLPNAGVPPSHFSDDMLLATHRRAVELQQRLIAAMHSLNEHQPTPCCPAANAIPQVDEILRRHANTLSFSSVFNAKAGYLLSSPDAASSALALATAYFIIFRQHRKYMGFWLTEEAALH
jgi:hypothetical protein